MRLLLPIMAIGVIILLAVALCQIPALRRHRIRVVRKDLDKALTRTEEAERIIAEAKAIAEKHQVIDPVLAELIRGTIEQGEGRLKRLPKPERQ